MLTELCQELRNWFNRDLPIWRGELSIVGGVPRMDGEPMELQEGQYYRIVGSVFNDGVHKYGDADLITERTTQCAVWAMAVPPSVVQLAEDIAAWDALYGAVDSVNMSPYNSESFGGYSYSKSGGGSSSGGTGGSSGGDWKSAFASRLNRWRKI